MIESFLSSMKRLNITEMTPVNEDKNSLKIDFIDIYKAHTTPGARNAIAGSQNSLYIIEYICATANCVSAANSEGFLQEQLRSILLESEVTSRSETNVTSMLNLFSFNEKQRKAIELLYNLLGGIGIFQGPPGASKTYWLIHVLLPLIKYRKKDDSRHKILLTTSDSLKYYIYSSPEHVFSARV